MEQIILITDMHCGLYSMVREVGVMWLLK